MHFGLYIAVGAVHLVARTILLITTAGARNITYICALHNFGDFDRVFVHVIVDRFFIHKCEKDRRRFVNHSSNTFPRLHITGRWVSSEISERIMENSTSIDRVSAQA